MCIPVILASKSQPRRDLLFNAGICPTIRVSHVDEDKALADAASKRGLTVDGLGIDEKVMILAEAKARAVYEAYQQIAQTSSEARGIRVTGWPLKAESASTESAASSETAGSLAGKTTSASAADAASAGDAVSSNQSGSGAEHTSETAADADPTTQTRDFSGVKIPTTSEDLQNAMKGQQSLTSSTVGPLILGCDSMFLLDGVAYGKPHTAEVARERLRSMSSSTGELWTGHCLIDFATGRVAKGASKATIHFSRLSDQMIERYIATGEPLEVAGSFTLDGYGSAFIDSIEGDPSGIIGLSLPLARQLVEQLGLDWTDLWNVSRDERFADGSSALMDAIPEGKPLPPKENVHQPGDGWVQCDCGRRHWGTNGAAGILLARRDEQTGEVTDVVMQHRAAWSAEGGTWGIPGGAIADGESPIEGALRESFEEANITPQDIEVVGSYCENHGPWAYTTVFAFEKPGHHVEPRANDDESKEIEWIPIDEVPNRKLLTAMRTDWPRFAQRLRELAQENRGE